ncbi:MAG TPA: cyclic nucleotide-binding domain-containing protein [Solimonas sp.]|nr:cyclic nucleotide-binding domain-containing protein [Solimonas sp.]
MTTDFNYIAHAAFLLLGLSYLIRDILFLRIAAVAASGCMILFNVLAYASPTWVLIQWNIVFITINCVHIIRLVHERSGIRFSGQEQELYDTLFAHMSRFEFRKLMRVAHWGDVKDGVLLVGEGRRHDAIQLLYSGRARVTVKGERVASLRDGAFIGEMGFLTDSLPAASVTAEGVCRLVSWPKAELKHLLQRNPGIRLSLHNVLARDVVRKLGTRAPVGIAAG